MERAARTDERLDDLALTVHSGFDRLDRDIRDVRQEIASLRLALLGVGGGIMVGLVGVIATLLAQGA